MTLNTYTCLDCGYEFDEPYELVERHGLDSPPFEKWLVCPACGGAYTHTHLCDCCGQRITDRYLRVDNGDEYCEDCVTEYNLGE